MFARIVFSLLLITPLCLTAQTIVSCGETFFDSGGENGPYAPNENITYQLCPDNPGDIVSLSFSQVLLGGGFFVPSDLLTVYNGIGTDDLIDGVIEPSGPFLSTSPDGCLTVTFVSDDIETDDGFAGTSSCIPRPSCFPPESLQEDVSTQNTISVTWFEAATASLYDVFIVIEGAPTPTVPTEEGVTNPYTFTGMMPSTSYDIYVRAVCEDGMDTDVSELTGPLTVSTLAVAPTNDLCSEAIGLTVGSDFCNLSGTVYTNDGSTPTAGLTEACGFGDDGMGNPADVWFSFVALSPSAIVRVSDISQVFEGSNREYGVYSGPCSGLTRLGCGERYTNLIPGTTYFIRVEEQRVFFPGDGGTDEGFRICVLDGGLPPGNDECDGAITLAVDPGPVCSMPTTATTEGASPSLMVNRCSGIDDDDVWFTFEATASKLLLYINDQDNVNGTFGRDMNFELFSGECGMLSSVFCGEYDSFGTINEVLEGLTVGEDYRLRLYTEGSESQLNFSICLATPAPNDECDGAIVAAVNPDLSNMVTTPGTTAGGTRSFAISSADSDCPTSVNDDDVWYTFTATAVEHFVSIINSEAVPDIGISFSPDAYVRLYPMDGCSADMELDCGLLQSDMEELTFTGLTVGQSYLLSVASSRTNYLNFELVIKTEPQLPVELISFTGDAGLKSNTLNWKVASEENFSHYELQRSANGAYNWEVLAEIQGAAAGARSGIKDYTFSDEQPLTNSYYRLRSVDLDGTFSFSPIITLKQLQVQAGIQVFPNPGNGRFEVTIPNTDAPVTFTVYSLDGRLVATAANVADLPVLSSGIYQLIAESAGERWRTRVVVR